MSIHFSHLRYKNILSTGNSWTEIPLDVNNTTLIIGQNGAGKSTMLDAICFALYGKAFRAIKIGQLVNSINKKGLEVELHLKTGGRDYIIKRGISPDFFDIICDGEPLNKNATKREQQANLEENVLKLDRKSFEQVLVLGSANFIPFMQLTTPKKRAVIEDLLDIQIFSVMNTLLKGDVDENSRELKDNAHQIEVIEAKIEAGQRHNDSIKNIKEAHVDGIKSRLSSQVEEAKKEFERKAPIQAKIDELLPQIAGLNEVLAEQAKWEKVKIDLYNKQTSLNKKQSFYVDNDNCPTCKQTITDDFKNGIVEDTKTTLTSIEVNLPKVEVKINSLQETIDDMSRINSRIDGYKRDLQDIQINLGVLKRNCKSIQNELDNANEGPSHKEMVDIPLTAYKELQNERETLSREREILSAAGVMLKDSGIKTQIVKQYIPVINDLCNKYLADMNFFAKFELDENFNEIIKSRYRDEFSHASFSEGEKLRIDLALLFTWRAISKMRNSVSTNLLIMDEILDSSLDYGGTDDFLGIIKGLVKDTNVFIISHKGDQLKDKFDECIEFEKVQNFSVRKHNDR